MKSHKAISFILPILVAAFAFGGIPQGASDIPVRFSHPDIIRYDHDGFIVHGKPIFIYSGSFHYFRCAPSEWMDRLEKIKAAGFNTIETYVPWNWHERKEGRPDFAPLEKFLDDCEQEGLYVILRPGPYICAEWNIGGFPDWLEGKNVGFRSASPADMKWSKYWYDEVLPVIRRHLITNGGPVILMQIENEYDYFSLPDSDKIVYLKSLYETAMKNGINIPIITCWTKQARDNSDSVFSQVMDACNFYPGWNISSTLPAIEQMKREEPASPPMITELQGGWFSNVGDKSVRHVNEFGPDQITALTDFVIAHGIKALSYYMLYGGTNFGYWGSQDKTTSYDYTAPISEPGGLWAKYRAVKLIGDFIKLEGSHLIDAHEVNGGAESETPDVEAVLRSDGRAGFLYVWNKSDKTVEAKVRFKPPMSSAVTMSVKLRPRAAYTLPVDLPLPGGETLFYTNVPVSAISEYNGKPLIIAYGNPGDEATIYAGSSMCTEEIRDADQLFNWDGLYVLLTTEGRAARSRVFETPSGPVALVSDSYLTIDKGSAGKTTVINIQTKPGADSFSLLAPGKVTSVSVDGKRVKTNIEGRPALVTFSLNTPALRLPNVPIRNVRAMADAEAPPASAWKPIESLGDTLAPLETQGDYESGYTVYSGQFSTETAAFLKADFYFEDWHSVLIDGKVVPGLTGTGKENISATKIPAGTHSIEVIYENQSWPNFGFIEQLKGLKSIAFSDMMGIERLDRWKHAPQPSPVPGSNPTEASDSYDDAGWSAVTVGSGNQSFIQPDQGWWFRSHVTMSDQALSEHASLTFGAVDDNALVYVNGKLAVNHKGYDTPFTIPLEGLARPGDNVIGVYVENQGGGGGIWKPVVLKWGRSVPLKVEMRIHHSLDGALAGWEESHFNDSGWKAVKNWNEVRSHDGIKWYRGDFMLPSKPRWVIPWRLHLVSTGGAQIWINGRLLGRYSSRGPQENFYLPDGWLNMNGKNSITLVVRPGSDGKSSPVIREAYIAPYEEYVVQKHEIKMAAQ